MIPTEVWWICIGALVGVLVVSTWRYRGHSPEPSDKENNQKQYTDPSNVQTGGPDFNGSND